MNNIHSLQVVGRGSEKQLQVEKIRFFVGLQGSNSDNEQESLPNVVYILAQHYTR